MFFSHQKPRKNTNDLLELVDQGILDPMEVLKSALNWMSDQEVLEFANANQFFLDDDDFQDDDDDQEDDQ